MRETWSISMTNAARFSNVNWMAFHLLLVKEAYERLRSQKKRSEREMEETPGRGIWGFSRAKIIAMILVDYGCLPGTTKSLTETFKALWRSAGSCERVSTEVNGCFRGQTLSWPTTPEFHRQAFHSAALEAASHNHTFINSRECVTSEPMGSLN